MNERRARISEVFLSIEGEGPYTGRPTLFVRFFGCNFTCSGFNNPEGEVIVYSKDQLKDKFQYSKGCDSAYSWHPNFKDQARFYTVDDLVSMIDAFKRKHLGDRFNGNPFNPILCFTGGEPMLYQEFIADFLNTSYAYDNFSNSHLLFESNGSLAPTDNLLETLQNYGVTWSFSPKLSASGEPWEKAIRPEVYTHTSWHDAVYLKFVTDGSEEMLAEIEKAVAEINAVLIEDNRSITASQIWLMPMGTTKEQQEAIQRKVAQQAINHGYNFCARVHVWVFDNEIGT